jgi:hypothetical protein
MGCWDFKERFPDFAIAPPKAKSKPKKFFLSFWLLQSLSLVMYPYSGASDNKYHGHRIKKKSLRVKRFARHSDVDFL